MSQKYQASQRSQSTSEESLSFGNSQKILENSDELVNNCVRYILYRAGNNLPIRKQELQKCVLQRIGRNFDHILRNVSKILKDVYGYDLYLNEDTNAVQYLISNALPNKNLNENNDESVLTSEVKKILIMLVLTHVFMSKNYVNEGSLFAFLKSANIDVEEKHELFGNVKEFVTTTMVKQKYLTTQVDEVTRKITYKWGSRAEHEISKHEILKFVSKIYKDKPPSSWIDQYKQANAQSPITEEAENLSEDDSTRG